MERVDLFAEELDVKALFYGAGGAGKTHLLATLAKVPQMRPVLWLNASGNPVTLRNALPDEALEYIDVFQIERLKNLNIVNYIIQGQPSSSAYREALGLDKIQFSNGRDPEEKYKSIVLDTFTAIQRLTLADVDGINWNNIDLATLTERADRKLYFASLDHTVRLSRALFELCPINVFVTCQEKELFSEKGSITGYQPLVQGQSLREVTSDAQLVARIMHSNAVTAGLRDQIGAPSGTRTILQIEPSPRAKLNKTQYADLGTYYFDPEMQELWDDING